MGFRVPPTNNATGLYSTTNYCMACMASYPAGQSHFCNGMNGMGGATYKGTWGTFPGAMIPVRPPEPDVIAEEDIRKIVRQELAEAIKTIRADLAAHVLGEQQNLRVALETVLTALLVKPAAKAKKK